MNESIHSIAFDAQAAALLQSSQLPTEDLDANPDIALFGCQREGSLAGLVGLELYGPESLLRSLAVHPRFTGQGLGESLLNHAEITAAAAGVKRLYLLTTTAAGYFEQRGYAHADRNSAPAAISRTRQFAGLCPASSAFMVKTLG